MTKNMVNWKRELFINTIEPVKLKRSDQISKGKYLTKGMYPIIDQGKEKIAGWTNNGQVIIRNNLPLIIFGDHTRIFKFVDFPFALGADGTKVIKPKGDYNPRYYFYYLINLDIPRKGYNRHYKLLKEKHIVGPSLFEQEKIASVLYKIQKAIETQEKVLENLKDLKKSTMKHLFTYGTRGEKTKQTEIGEIPESWEVGYFDDLCSLAKDTIIPENYQGSVYVGLEHLESGGFYIDSVGLPEDVSSSKTIFKAHDVLYGKLRPYLDKAAISDCEGICSTDILVLRNKKDVSPWYIGGIMHSEDFRDYANHTTHGVNHPRTSWKSIRNYLIPKMSKKESDYIGGILRSLENKIHEVQLKKVLFENLLKSTLNKLMTGEIRLNNLEIDVSEVTINE